MKALVCDRYGSLDDIKYQDIEIRPPAAGEILVKVRAAGVMFTDVLFALGKYQSMPPLPFILGSELAGDVVEVGNGVDAFTVGDHIASLAINFGAFAQYVVLPAWLPSKLPVGISNEVGAALMSSSATAHHALRQGAAIRPGEILIVTGAAGGTGNAAIQVGKAMGAHVIAVCSSPERAAFCRRLGADDAIEYTNEDLKRAIKEKTGGRGADVVFETVGGDVFDACASAMAIGGRLLVIGFASGRIPLLPVNLPLVKCYALIGIHWLTFVQRNPEIHHHNMTELLGWVEEGRVKPEISKIFPLSDGVSALRELADRRAMGKIVLVP